MIDLVNKEVGNRQLTRGNLFPVRFLIAFLFVLSSFFAFANEEAVVDSAAVHAGATEEHAAKGEKFSAGKLIMGHIADAHDWHIYGSEEHPVSIPLPVIIYNKTKGFSVFSSSRFDHGHASYEGYK